MHGFAVRLDEVRRDSDGCVIMRQIVCNRAGSRKEEVEKDERIRDHRPLTQSCCRARIRARLDRKIHKWKVVSFYEEHSHGLVDPLDVSMMLEYRTFILVTSLPTLEDFAAKTFTRNMFREVRKEIEGACAMNTELVIQDGGKLYFKCNNFGMPEIDHVVEFDRVGGMLRCECLWFENRGISCMHIFTCLKHQHVEVIPERLVCKCWMKNAKSDFMKSNVDDPSDSDKVLKCRLGVLGAECSRLMDVASKNSSDFVEAMNDVVNTITKLQNVTGHYNKSCPNVSGRIPKEPVDDDTEKNISSYLDILTKRKRHDSMKNQQKMEKDRNIGGGTTPISAAKLAFTDK
ncbi:hypothetical protein HN873_036406 [Arachis hypogaea]